MDAADSSNTMWCVLHTYVTGGARLVSRVGARTMAFSSLPPDTAVRVRRYLSAVCRLWYHKDTGEVEILDDLLYLVLAPVRARYIVYTHTGPGLPVRAVSEAYVCVYARRR